MAFVMLSISFTACNNACRNTVCQNTGQCNGGACSCPSGYSGNLCQMSSIVFTNNTPTEIYMVVNSMSGVIPPNGITRAFTDTSGKAANVYAFTVGTLSSGLPAGDTVKWTTTYNFPTTATSDTALQEPLNVGASYFYLNIVNNDTALQTVDSVVVDYGTGITTNGISIPPNNISYGIGYYTANTSTTVTAYGSKGSVWTFTNAQLALPYTTNQAVTITIP